MEEKKEDGLKTANLMQTIPFLPYIFLHCVGSNDFETLHTLHSYEGIYHQIWSWYVQPLPALRTYQPLHQ